MGNAFRGMKAHHAVDSKWVAKSGKEARRHRERRDGRCGAGNTPVLLTSASKGEGTDAVIEALEKHDRWSVDIRRAGGAAHQATCRADARGGGPVGPSLDLAGDPRRGDGAGAPRRPFRRADQPVRAGTRHRGRCEGRAPGMSARRSWSGCGPNRGLAVGLRNAARCDGTSNFRASRGARSSRSTPRSRRDLGDATELPGIWAFTRGIHPTMYRGKLWTMRQFAGLRHRGGHQPALQVPAGAGTDRLVRRVRFSHADGIRLRPSALRGRGRRAGSRSRAWPTWKPCSTDSARSGLHVDDHQRAGGHPLLFLRGGGRAAGGGSPEAPGHGAERHPQGVHGAARVGASAGARAQDHRGHVRVGGGAYAAMEHDFDFGVPHPRGGATATQELAFTLANGFSYIEHGIARGLAVDTFAPRLSFFWDVHNDFFEEIAKMRAARRIRVHSRELPGTGRAQLEDAVSLSDRGVTSPPSSR